MQKLVFTNGNGESIDLTSAPYGITKWEGFSNAELNIQMQQVPFQDGGVYLDALINSRELSVTLAIQDNNNLSLRYEYRRNLISVLNPKLGEGTLVYTNDYLSKQIKVVPQIPLFENHNSNDSGTPKASLTFTACSPYWEDVEETIYIIKKGIFKINNNGDIPTSLHIDLFTSSAQQLSLKNFTVNKELTFSNTITKNVRINTDIGKKEVVTTSINWNGENKDTLNSVCYNEDLNLFVAVGDRGKILTSSDSIHWTAQTNEIRQNYLDMCYCDFLGMFIAVGSRVSTSLDGVNWASQEIQSVSEIYGVCCSNNLVILVGDNGEILTSSDGENWTLQTTLNVYLESICYSPDLGLFVAVGTDIFTSPDGETWTNVSENVTLSGVCWADTLGLFVAVGTDIFTSPDGETWTNVIENTVLHSIKFLNNLLIAVGSSGLIYTSSDGTTWNNIDLQIMGLFFDVSYSTIINTYLVVGEAGLIYTSIDGENWICVTNSISNSFEGLCYSEKLKMFVAITLYYNEYSAIWRSFDGINWEKTIVISGVKSLCYSEEKEIFVAVGASAETAISSDGINWEFTSRGSTDRLNSICYSPNLEIFIAVGGYNEDGAVYISPDGVNWNAVDVEDYLYSVCWADDLGLFIAVGNNRAIYTSPDGTTWTRRLYQEGNDLRGVCWAKDLGLLVAVGDNGIIYTSPDGENWTLISTDLTSRIYSVVYSSTVNMFVAVGGSTSIILTSPDGVNWTSYTDISGNALYFVCYSSDLNMFLLAGENGQIYLSDLTSEENIISELTQDSDMTYNLDIGENTLMLSALGVVSGRITFRNRYIGV